MRYTTLSGHPTPFNAGVRPPLDLIPEPLAIKIRERDRILAQYSEALQHLREVSREHLTAAAQKSDDDAAAQAARAGKTVPAPKLLPKLEQERAAAAHALSAQEAALTQITTECEYLATDDLYWSVLERVNVERDALRTQIAEQAAALADAVEAAVTQFAVTDWLRTGVYSTTAQTWPTEIFDLTRHGLERTATSPKNIRDVIVTAATTLLEEDK